MDELRIIRARMPDQVEDLMTTKTENESKKDIKEEIKKETEEKLKEEEEKKKRAESNLKNYIINEEDMKVLLLMFGSKGNSTLLEQIIEKRKKERHS